MFVLVGYTSDLAYDTGYDGTHDYTAYNSDEYGGATDPAAAYDHTGAKVGCGTICLLCAARLYHRPAPPTVLTAVACF